jgi:hypothetical protein
MVDKSSESKENAMELRRVSLRGGCWVSEWVRSTECGSEKAVMKWVGVTDRRWDKLLDERTDFQRVS